jgi:glucosamine--fructose-6-phosphate aminotransferase (isomerizing)
MIEAQSATLDEILSQTQAWQEAIRAVSDAHIQIGKLPWDSYSQILFIGCGSTFYLSMSAAATFQSITGKTCRAFPSSELMLFPSSVYPRQAKNILLVAVSRSGTTTETVMAAQAHLQTGYGDLITVSNHEESALASMGRINITIPGGKECSVAQTRSFASMYVACLALAMASTGEISYDQTLNRLAPAGLKLIQSYGELARKVGEDHQLKRFYFLGSGIQYGLASEASLKMKEMSLSESEPFHFFEFRHGPVSMVDKQTCLVGLLSSSRYEDEIKVIEEAKTYGAQSITLGETGAKVNFASGVPEPVRGVLYLPVLQLMAYFRAVSFGLNPDQPRHLNAVVELS